MRRRFATFGLLLSITLVIAGSLVPTDSFGAESSSYMLHSNYENENVQSGGASTNYSLAESQLTWEQKPAASNTYTLATVTDNSGVSSSAGGTTGGTGGTGGQTGGSGGDGSDPGNRRPREEQSSSSSAGPISGGTQSSSSSLSSSARGTASSSSSVPSSVIRDGIEGIDYEVIGETAHLIKTFSFFDVVDEKPCTETVIALHGAADPDRNSWLMLLIVLLVLGFAVVWDMSHISTHAPGKKRKATKRTSGARRTLTILLLCVTVASVFPADHLHAVQTAPNTNAYNGRLLDSSGNPVTTAVSVRFSYWNTTDYVTGDVDGSGNINTGAATYVGWTEVHTVTPDSTGRFSVKLGSVTSLPDFSTLSIGNLLSLYLQVEVKPSASANTAYELLDIDPSDTAIDRSGILSVPFAQNADLIDQREIGTGSGNIAILGPGGTFSKAAIPGGTNSGVMVIDADDTEASQIVLQFGTTLAKKLTYDITNTIFRFNDDVAIQGNLTVTGLINGVDVSNLQSSTGALKAFSGGGLNLNIADGTYRLNGSLSSRAGDSIILAANTTNYVFYGSGGLTRNTSGFPTDESYIPVAEVTTNAGAITGIDDRRAMSSDDREVNVNKVLNPAFENASYQGDGANNVGQLSVSFDNTNKRNFYLWTSTKSTLQDYDIFVKIPLSPNFVRWLQTSTENPITVTYRSTSASTASNKLDMTVYDTNGVPVTLSGSATDLAGTSWTSSQMEFTGSPTWTAGNDMLIKLTVSAKDSEQIHIGGLKLQYIDLE